MPLHCPNCNCLHCRVTDTRTQEFTFHGTRRVIIRRRRVCRYCGTSFYSVEQPEEDMLKDGEDGAPTPERSDGNPYL